MTTNSELPKNGMRAIPPGEILKEDFLDPLGITPVAFAEHLHVVPFVVDGILDGTGKIEAFTAMLFARALGTTVEFWLNLQNTFDIRSIEISNPGFPSFVQPIIQKGNVDAKAQG